MAKRKRHVGKKSIKKRKTPTGNGRARMTETNGGDARDETQEIAAVRRGEAHAMNEAEGARAAAAEAQREVERVAQALAKKDEELNAVKSEFLAVGERLAVMPLDDPASEKVGGRHRHLELVLKRLEGECGSLEGVVAVARSQADHLRQRAEMCEATARNAQRGVELQRLREAFPLLLDGILDLIRDHRMVLGAADDESAAANLPRLGRARLFPRRDQLRKDDMDELALILTRHSSGLALVPSGALSAFTLEQDRNGDGEASADEPVEPEVPAQPEDEWIDAVIAEQEIAELEAGMPLEET